MVDRKPSAVEPTERICDSIIDTIDNTSLVRLSRLVEASDVHAEITAKFGFFNPVASVNDRIGLAMMEHLEREGRINPGIVIFEPTSGNTSIALAFVAA
ncbi:MAG: pyridoxal-phosphate dependent enzyme, partial [Pseudomonadota bacterium]|nr:pyridoxal-phosphate dependent enzyme [Pseudomonadota bacterium]